MSKVIVKKKSRAQVFLERVEVDDAIIPNKLIERQQWKDLAQSITAHMGDERVQSSGSKSKMEDAVIRCTDMEAEILSAVEKLIATKQKAVSILEQLEIPIRYKILHMRYIQYIEFEDIAEKLGMEYSNVTTIHGRALKDVEAILDEKCD